MLLQTEWCDDEKMETASEMLQQMMSGKLSTRYLLPVYVKGRSSALPVMVSFKNNWFFFFFFFSIFEIKGPFRENFILCQ